MVKSNWETIEILEEGDEDNEPCSPISLDNELAEIKLQLEELEQKYKDKTHYDEFRLYYSWKSTGFGGMKKWWEIQGRYSDPTKIVLYGKKD